MENRYEYYRQGERGDIYYRAQVGKTRQELIEQGAFDYTQPPRFVASLQEAVELYEAEEANKKSYWEGRPEQYVAGMLPGY